MFSQLCENTSAIGADEGTATVRTRTASDK